MKSPAWPPEGMIELPFVAGRGAVLFGSVLAALIWNALIVVVAVQWQNWDTTSMTVCSVSAGIGVLLVCSAVHCARQCFNLHMAVAVSRPTVKPGESFEVAWHIDGKHRRLTRLKIWLEGREEITVDSPEGSTKESSLLARVSLVDQDEDNVITAGSTTARVPAGSEHSWEKGNCQTVWRIRLRAKIPYMPEMNDECAIVVVPDKAARPEADPPTAEATAVPAQEDDALRLQICPHCAYSLTGLPLEGVCPECGTRYDQGEVILYGWAMGDHAGFHNCRPGCLIWGMAVIAALTWFMLQPLLLVQVVRLDFVQGCLFLCMAGQLACSWLCVAVQLTLRWTSPLPGPAQVRLSALGCRQIDDLGASKATLRLYYASQWTATVLAVPVLVGFFFSCWLPVAALVLGVVIWVSELPRRNRPPTPWTETDEVQIVPRSSGRLSLRITRPSSSPDLISSVSVMLPGPPALTDALRQRIYQWRIVPLGDRCPPWWNDIQLPKESDWSNCPPPGSC